MAMFKCGGDIFRCAITVYTTAGATVTATTPSTTRVFTAVANVGGVAVITVKKRGLYAIASTGSARLSHANVTSRTPVTAYYTWQKWNSISYYIQQTETITLNSGEELVIESGSTKQGLLYGTSATLNPANGIYTIDNPQYVYDSLRGAGYYCIGSVSSGAVMYRSNDSACVYMCYYRAISGKQIVITNIAGTSPVSWTKYTSALTYSKGSTRYADATAERENAYPINGRYATDGYWYVAA